MAIYAQATINEYDLVRYFKMTDINLKSYEEKPYLANEVHMIEREPSNVCLWVNKAAVARLIFGGES